jgi:hypothetical protein
MTKNTVNETERMVVTRVFDAPRALVWEAWTNPKANWSRSRPDRSHRFWYLRIIKGRPFGVGFECLAQPLQKGHPL